MCDTSLIAEYVSAGLCICRIGRPVRIVGIDPSVRTVVDGLPQNGHVVGVENSMNKSYAHPIADEISCSLADF